MKSILEKLKKLKKRYYILAVVIVMFLVYNSITLHGLYYVHEGSCDQGGYFAFLKGGKGYTDVAGHSYAPPSGRSYFPRVNNVEDTAHADRGYLSIFGTVVFMPTEWIGIHIGNYMFLYDLWTPEDFWGDNQILGHPYYFTKRYERFVDFPKNQKLSGDARTKRNKRWQHNSAKWSKYKIAYRVGTVAFYVILAGGIVVMWRKRRKAKKAKNATV